MSEIAAAVRMNQASTRDKQRTFAMLDLALAVGHHLLIFGLFGVILAELIVVRPRMSQAAINKVASVDRWYGVLAVLILIVGFSRAIFAAKGWDYYASNGFFIAKIATFAVIGVVSVWPTICFIRWRRANLPPDDVQVVMVRRLIYVEPALFALLPAFAAAMARGYWEF
jgi:putative membrane protein